VAGDRNERAVTQPRRLTVGAGEVVVVVGADEQTDVEVDVDRWCGLAAAAVRDCGRHGEITLTFVDPDEIADLNAQHLGKSGPTDVLSFPLDADAQVESGDDSVPVLLGDVVVCPDVARAQAPTHAGTLDDELALLVVHGVLHVLGYDHGEAAETEAMRSRELELLVAHHWGSPPPDGFRQAQD
jgi:probable rRNA maturation factor